MAKNKYEEPSAIGTVPSLRLEFAVYSHSATLCLDRYFGQGRIISRSIAMSSFQRGVISSLLAVLASSDTAGAVNDVQAGFNAFSAAQVMVDIASHSWEFGTAAEALLELYNPELSVFGADPFPNGGIPDAAADTFALSYARQFINRDSQVFVGNSAVGDPASLGVSAILLGQSDGTYIGASDREEDFLINIAPRFSNGAISQRPDVAELWADNMAMSFPFCMC
jgi:hypothetical protein